MEGLCHNGGPQLRVGAALGVSAHHFYLTPCDLYIHYTKLPAGLVCI